MGEFMLQKTGSPLASVGGFTMGLAKLGGLAADQLDVLRGLALRMNDVRQG